MQHTRTYSAQSLGELQGQIEADRVLNEWTILQASHQTSGHGSMAIPFHYTAMVIFEGGPQTYEPEPASGLSADGALGFGATIMATTVLLLLFALGVWP